VFWSHLHPLQGSNNLSQEKKYNERIECEKKVKLVQEKEEEGAQ
jgi:hypothetical protein